MKLKRFASEGLLQEETFLWSDLAIPFLMSRNSDDLLYFKPLLGALLNAVEERVDFMTVAASAPPAVPSTEWI